MKTTATIIILAIQALGAFTTAAAGPADLPLGVQVFEETPGNLVVREVSANSNPLQKRCRECVHLAGKCTIGHGSCYAREKASCTWCGDKCGSICVMSGTKCSDWCGK
ncbi:hypothetical protein PspLS_01532 [Pyricularia sp. CBS 133598]|nr:hypothetical protein PspLS_01532 [Pyricularia sp. CBS 133598]